jgi:hypothetical protein
MLTIFVSVTLVVLLAAAVMLLIRGVVLVFIMMTSPLGFVATAVPQLQGIAGTWRKLLISEAFFAPVLLLLILVSLKILTTLSSAINPGGSSTLVAAVSSGNTNINFTGIILLFALVIGFMIASLMSAKQLGAVGATAVTNAATKAVRSTVTAPLRLGAFGAGVGFRAGVGAVAPGLASRYNNMIGAARARGGAAGALAFGFDRLAGGAITGGLQKVQDTSLGGAKSYTDRKKEIDARDKVTGKLGKVALTRDAVKNAVPPQRAGESNADYQKRLDAGFKALNSMSQDTLEGTLESGLSHDELNFIATNVSTAKARAVAESDHVKSAEKKEFINARLANLIKLREAHEADVTDPTKTDAERAASYKALEQVTHKLSTDERAFIAVSAPNEYSALNNLRNTYDPSSYGNSVWKESQIDADLANKDVSNSEKLKLRASKKFEQLNEAHAKLLEAQTNLANGIAGAGAQVAAQIDEINKLAKSTAELGKAETETVMAVAEHAPIEMRHLQSVVTEGNITSDAELDDLFTKITDYHNANVGTAGYDQAKYDRLKNWSRTNAAALNRFGNRGQSLP